MLSSFSKKIWEVVKKNPKDNQVVKKFSCKPNITENCSVFLHETCLHIHFSHVSAYKLGVICNFGQQLVQIL